MPSTCSVARCPSRGTDYIPGKTISYFRFPIDSDVKEKWIEACKRTEAFKTSNARICEEHFQDSDYVRNLKAELLGFVPAKKCLKKDAVPSLNLPEANTEGKTNKLREIGNSINAERAPRENCSNSSTEIPVALDLTNHSKQTNQVVSPSKQMKLQVDSTEIATALDSANYSLVELKVHTKSSKQKLQKISRKMKKVDICMQTEFEPQDCSNLSTEILASCDSPNLSSDDLRDYGQKPRFSKHQTQRLEKNAIQKSSLQKKKNSKSRCRKPAQQDCKNCSDMLLHSVVAKKQLIDLKKQVLELQEENKSLKEELSKRDKVRLKNEMEKIFSNILNKSQIQCLINHAKNSRLMGGDVDSSLKIKPIGTYRLYSLPKDTITVDSEQFTVLETNGIVS